MKRSILFFLFIVSIISFSTEKSTEEVMEEYKEKVSKKEEVKIKEEKEEKKQENILESKDREVAMKLIEEKRRQITVEPLEEKYSRAEDKGKAYEKALEIAEARMSFIEVKNSEDPVLKEYKTNISKKYDDVKEERAKILAEREKIQKQLADLDKLEAKVKDW
ncbi:stress response protein NST1 [Fusobacterium polymorphum]|mgnify:FL=1|uniref:stress response protein NST1 n=1 Tax=Fusobacterium nucleatum subsp. polymorphum TaxID=76857 RepID=UPI003009CCA4